MHIVAKFVGVTKLYNLEWKERGGWGYGWV